MIWRGTNVAYSVREAILETQKSTVSAPSGYVESYFK